MLTSSYCTSWFVEGHTLPFSPGYSNLVKTIIILLLLLLTFASLLIIIEKQPTEKKQ